jgi:hypothetical protein
MTPAEKFDTMSGKWKSVLEESDPGTPEEINEYLSEGGRRLRRNYDYHENWEYTQGLTNFDHDSFTATVIEDGSAESSVGSTATVRYRIEGSKMWQWWTTDEVTDHLVIYEKVE